MRNRAFEGSEAIMTNDLANPQALHSTQFADFETSPRPRAQLAPLLGTSIFSTDGAFREHSHTMFRPQFWRVNINDLESTNRACDQLIEALGPCDADGRTGESKLLDHLLNLTLDTAPEFLFGVSAGALRQLRIRRNYPEPTTAREKFSTLHQRKNLARTSPAMNY